MYFFTQSCLGEDILRKFIRNNLDYVEEGRELYELMYCSATFSACSFVSAGEKNPDASLHM